MELGNAAAGLATDFILTSGYYQRVPFVDDAAGGHDDHDPEITAGGFWQNNTHEYRAAVAGAYTFKVRLTANQGPEDFFGWAYHNDIQLDVWLGGYSDPYREITITMAAGDTFYCTAKKETGDSKYLESGATVGDNDGTWIKITSVPFMKYGCMDPTAENYDEEANIDDESCTYPAPDDSEDTPIQRPITLGPLRTPDMNIYTTFPKILQDSLPQEPMIYDGEDMIISLDLRNIVYKWSAIKEILPRDFKSY